jgi:hypothetical protein
LDLPETPSSMCVRSRFSNSARRPALPLLQHVARIEARRLLLADVGPARAVHQHLADAVEDRPEREEQAMNRDVPAIAENPRAVARNRLRDVDSVVVVFTRAAADGACHC